jgi:hypothetical protein
MERIQALINRLQDQLNQQADAVQMLSTLQQIQGELLKSLTESTKTLGTSKISVLMPASNQVEKMEVENEIAAPKPKESKSIKQPLIQFDSLDEMPTFSQQQEVKEVNDSVSQSESLNDKLKENKVEVMQALKDSPIKDLRKAIGINERFVFISELFRDDEAMFERCLKTINSFNIYPEAEYWMNRELMLKLGWPEKSETVKHFYQLVKRRFS